MPKALIRARYGALPFAPAETPPALAPLLDRRVTRRYRPDPVPDALLDLVLAGAQSAPSKSDLQQYSVIVTRDAAKIASVAEAIGTMPWITGAPVFLLFCGDMRRGRRICALHGRDHAKRQRRHLHETPAWTPRWRWASASWPPPPRGSARARSPNPQPPAARRAAVRAAGRRLPVAGLTLGWPEARNDPSPRLPPAVVVHRERYADGDLGAVLPGL
jgi:nitroreductase/FMN reductase [NAD(P)H]